MQEKGCLIAGIPLLVKKPEQLCLLLLLLIFAPNASSQAIDNRYISHLSNEGITYFFCPKHLRHTQNIEDFTFDMTYHTRSDSVTLNFSFVAKEPVSVKSFFLQSGPTERYEGKCVATLFRDVKKKKYEIRTTSKFSLEDIQYVYSKKAPLLFEMNLNNGITGSATYGQSQWNRECRQIIHIINLISSPQ